MDKKRTTDLFRFATLRAPQLLTSERRSLGFIEHPDYSASAILDGVNLDTDSFIEMKTKVSNNASSFASFAKVDDVKAISNNFYEFALWLGTHKNVLERSELDSVVPTNISTSEYIKLWDNVYYDLVVEDNPPIRQACLQCIVAYNFIDKYQTYSPGTTSDEAEQEKESELLKRLANGKVIIHKAFTSIKEIGSNTSVPSVIQSFQKMASMHSGYRSGLKVPALEIICDDLLDLEETHNSEYQAVHSRALQTHEKAVDEILNNYIKENPDIVNQENIEELIPDTILPDFTFSFDAPLSASYRQEKISETTERYIQNNRLSLFN